MDYKNFLSLLNREKSLPTIFEPFPTRQIVTQILWRGGNELWDTPKRRTETLIEFYKYIKSDVAVTELCGEYDILNTELPCGMKFVIISNDPEELYFASKSEKVCALATSGEYTDFDIPLIYLSKKGEDEQSVLNADSRFAAVYLTKCTQKPSRTVLGGIGIELINSGSPMKIQSRMDALASLGINAVGSGGLGEKTEYLGFISMLGKYNNMRFK